MNVPKETSHTADVKVRNIILENRNFVYDEHEIKNTGLKEMKLAKEKDKLNKCCALVLVVGSNYYKYTRCKYITVNADAYYCAAHDTKHGIVYGTYKNKCPAEEPATDPALSIEMKQRNDIGEIRSRRAKLLDCYEYRLTYNWLFRNELIRVGMIDAGHIFYMDSLTRKINDIDEYIESMPKKKISPTSKKEKEIGRTIQLGDVTVSIGSGLSDRRTEKGSEKEEVKKEKKKKKKKNKSKPKLKLREGGGDFDLEGAIILNEEENQKKRISSLLGSSVLSLPHMKAVDVEIERSNVDWSSDLSPTDEDSDLLLSIFGKTEYAKEMTSSLEELMEDMEKMIEVCKKYKSEFTFKNIDDITSKSIYFPYETKEFYAENPKIDNFPSLHLFFETFNFLDYVKKIEKISNAILAFVDNIVPKYLQQRYGYPGNIYESFFYAKYIKTIKDDYDKTIEEYKARSMDVDAYHLDDFIEFNWASYTLFMLFRRDLFLTEEGKGPSLDSSFRETMRKYVRLLINDPFVSIILIYAPLADIVFRSFFSLKELLKGMNYDVNLFFREPVYIYRESPTFESVKKLRDSVMKTAYVYASKVSRKNKELEIMKRIIKTDFPNIYDRVETPPLNEIYDDEALKAYQVLYGHLYEFAFKHPNLPLDVLKILDATEEPNPDLIVENTDLWERFFDKVIRSTLNGKLTPFYVIEILKKRDSGFEAVSPYYMHIYRLMLDRVAKED